jgi:WD40 repeat protein
LDTKFIGHKGNINAITISPDGKKILTVSDDLTARIWQLDWKYVSDDFNNSGVVIKLPSNRQTTTFTNRFLKDQRILVTGFDGNVISESMRRADEINPPAFSTDGKTVVTGSLENILSSQGVDEKIIAVFKRQKNLADIVAFSPDGKKMLTSAFDSVACMWGADGEMIKEFKHNSKIKSIAFSPDGKNILTGSLNGIARLWALDGTMMREFKHPDISFQKKGLLGVKRETIKQSIDYVAFSSSGDTILTGSANKIRLWALDSSLLKEFDLDRSEFAKFVSFSPDGNMILTASNDSIRLWDTNGKLNGKFKINVSSLNALAFSADGKRIIICADDFGHTISDRLPLQDFLNSNQLEPLSAEQKKQFGITDITDSKPQQIKIPKK